MAEIKYHSNPFAINVWALSRILSANGVNLLQTSFMSLLVVGITVIILGIGIGSFSSSVGTGIILTVLSGLIFALGVSMTLGAITYSVIYALEGKKLDTKTAFTLGKNKAVPMFGLLITMLVIIVIGLILFIFPGLIFLGWFAYAPYILLKTDASITQALSQSKQIASGHLWETYGAILASYCILGPYGLLSNVGNMVAIGGRYDEISKAKDNDSVDETHYLNYLMPLIGIALILVYIAILSLNIGNNINSKTSITSPSSNIDNTITQ